MCVMLCGRLPTLARARVSSSLGLALGACNSTQLRRTCAAWRATMCAVAVVVVVVVVVVSPSLSFSLSVPPPTPQLSHPCVPVQRPGTRVLLHRSTMHTPHATVSIGTRREPWRYIDTTTAGGIQGTVRARNAIMAAPCDILPSIFIYIYNSLCLCSSLHRLLLLLLLLLLLVVVSLSPSLVALGQPSPTYLSCSSSSSHRSR